MSTQDEPKPEDKPIDTTVLVVLLTALAYAAAYTSERGYANYFGLPPEFTEVSLRGLLLFGAGLAGLAVFFPILNGMVLILSPNWHPALRRAVRNAVALPIAFLIMIFFIGMPHVVLLIFLVVISVGFALFELLLPHLAYREKATYAERLEASWNAQPPGRGLDAMAARRFGRRWVGRALLALGVICVAWGLGYREARTQERFLVPTSGTPCAVLRPYGDTLVCIHFDAQKREVTPQFRLIPMSDPNTELLLRELGPFAAYDETMRKEKEAS